MHGYVLNGMTSASSAVVALTDGRHHNRVFASRGLASFSELYVSDATVPGKRAVCPKRARRAKIKRINQD